MTPEQIHDIAVDEFGLESRTLVDGISYWTPEAAETKRFRVVRVSRTANGGVREVKLVVSSLSSGQDELFTSSFY